MILKDNIKILKFRLKTNFDNKISTRTTIKRTLILMNSKIDQDSNIKILVKNTNISARISLDLMKMFKIKENLNIIKGF
jgi:hypothetical protein